ncbi:hypothetical protein A6X21_09775 [Planctopirus hydrillae]|uniref:Uncharacterized protein n=1 Tax=Planctopirus hydrillae TaxID=1841610 RepID=A0A1C3E7A2_9PLAN|nr:hypothetical protein A6X21_09775 [Planctopirus hydrillae]
MVAKVRILTKAPRVDQQENQPLPEVGAFQINKLRRRPTIDFYPWCAVEVNDSDSPSGEPVNRDPLALAHFYQSLLDSNVVDSRAALARYLGVSRARVTQVLNRLKR